MKVKEITRFARSKWFHLVYSLDTPGFPSSSFSFISRFRDSSICLLTLGTWTNVGAYAISSAYHTDIRTCVNVRERHSNAWPWTMILSGCEPWQRIGVARWLFEEYRRMEERREGSWKEANDARFAKNAGPGSNEGDQPRRRPGHAGNVVLCSRRSRKILENCLD